MAHLERRRRPAWPRINSSTSASPTTPDYDPRFAPRFAEIATFMRAPYQPDLADVDIGICGVPFDGGATNRVGRPPRPARGARSLLADARDASRHPHQPVRRSAASPTSATCGSIRCSTMRRRGRHRRVLPALRARPASTPLSIGGDHSITYAILKGIVRDGAGRPRAYRRAYRHARADPGRALPPRLAVPQRHRGRAARSQAHGADRHSRRA